VFELTAAVRGVGRHQDHSGQADALLKDDPVRAVGGPDRHAIARLEALEQGPRSTLGILQELGIGPFLPCRRVLHAVDECQPVWHYRRRLAQ